jgi:cytochrome P450
MDVFEFDPFNPEYYADPFPYYRELREHHPVYRREIPDSRIWPHYWMLSRSDDVNNALSDWRTFSSARGTLIDTDITLLPPNMFNMDPPRHDELRGILARVLTPSRIAGLEPQVRAYAESLIEEFRHTGSFDAALDYAQKLPTTTMCALMDLPVEERNQFLKWNLDTLAGDDFTSPAALQAYSEMAAYWEGLVAERRVHKGDDLISQILHTEVQGDQLSDAEVAGFCSLLHDASQNTTMNMISHSVMTLARFPGHRRRLRQEPELWGNAVEELLRFISPVQGLARTTTRDVELHSVTIPEGDQVLVLYGSANHDPEAYPDPDVLDFDRKVKVHWAFGHGTHYCLGNAVARLEVRVALQALVDLVGDWDLEESKVQLNQLVPTRGVGLAPIRFAIR